MHISVLKIKLLKINTTLWSTYNFFAFQLQMNPPTHFKNCQKTNLLKLNASTVNVIFLSSILMSIKQHSLVDNYLILRLVFFPASSSIKWLIYVLFICSHFILYGTFPFHLRSFIKIKLYRALFCRYYPHYTGR